jgi:hypothetical protein
MENTRISHLLRVLPGDIKVPKDLADDVRYFYATLGIHEDDENRAIDHRHFEDNNLYEEITKHELLSYIDRRLDSDCWCSEGKLYSMCHGQDDTKKLLEQIAKDNCLKF